MPPKRKHQRRKAHDITLRDVVNHMSAMEQRLSGGIESNTKGIEANTKGIAENTKGIEENRRAVAANAAAIQDVKITLSERMDALEQDLTATILDTIKIRGHVGMPVPSEG